MFIYVDPTDNMNKITFRAFVTGHYEPRLPKRFIRHSQRPIYPDIDQFAEARITPATVVDMYYHNKEFSIPSEKDMKEIIRIIENYVDHAKATKGISNEIRIYVDKCNTALLALKEAYNGMVHYREQKFPGVFDQYSKAFKMFYEKLKVRDGK